MKKFSLRTKLLGGFIIGGLIVCVMGFIGVLGLTKADKAAEEMNRQLGTNSLSS